RVAKLDGGDLGDRVGAVGLLQRSSQEVLLLERLGRQLRVDAGGTEIEELAHAATVGGVDDVEAYAQVDVDEVGRVGVVGKDAAYLGGCEDDDLWPLGTEEGVGGGLVAQVELARGASDDVGVAVALQAPKDGAAY